MSLLNCKAVDFEASWKDLETSLASMMLGVDNNNNAMTPDDWLRLYTGVYKICTNLSRPQGELLYYRLQGLLETHCEEILKQLSTHVGGDFDFLKKYCHQYHLYSTGMSYGAELFSYLNRYWIKNSHCENGVNPRPGVYPVWELALHTWRNVVFSHVKQRVVGSVLSIMRDARNSGRLAMEQGEVIIATVRTYVDIGLNKQDPLKLYRDELEVHFVKDAADYFFGFSSQYIQSVSISKYLERVEKICAEELSRCEGHVHHITVSQTSQACYQVLVENHADYLCSEVDSFLEKGQIKDLRRLFNLFARLSDIKSLQKLKTIFRKFVEKEGLVTMERFDQHAAFEASDVYIESLLDVREKYLNVVKTAFNSNITMRAALDQACTSFINSNRRLAELLARYAHHLMDVSKVSRSGRRRGARLRMKEADIENQIDNVGIIFCLLDDKDVFKKFYAKLLGKRLIRASSASDDTELFMIRKLREICGHDFVAKLQRMLSDKDLCKDLNKEFHSWNTKSHPDGLKLIDLNVMVLTTGSWPLETPVNSLTLPDKLQLCIERFTAFYSERSTGRRLHWALDLSTGDVVAHCFRRKYDFHVNTFHMVILFLFNQVDTLTMKEISATLKLPMVETIRHVDALVTAKVLLQEGAEGDSRLTLNLQYFNKRIKVKIISTIYVHTQKEIVSTHREINEDRKMVVQAAIVRIMKTRGQLDHNTLVSEVVEVLKINFVATVASIKRNIETLIEKEYIRRTNDSEDASYVYVA